MANRRMFAKSVVCNDSFLDLSHAAQALYLQLGVNADDDGFVDSPRTIMRMTNCKQEQLDELEGKGFIITFPSGVLVQRHWKQNNQIRPDRYTKTAYQEELSRLTVDKNGCYLAVKEGGQPDVNQTETTCQPSDNQTEPQCSLGEFSLEKVKTGEGRGEKGKIEKERCGEPIEREPTPKQEDFPDDESYHIAFNDWAARNRI